MTLLCSCKLLLVLHPNDTASSQTCLYPTPPSCFLPSEAFQKFFIWTEIERDTHREILSTISLAKWSQVSKPGSSSPKLCASCLCWVSHRNAGTQGLEPYSATFLGHKQGAELKVELEPAHIRDAGNRGGSLAYYAVVLALKTLNKLYR